MSLILNASQKKVLNQVSRKLRSIDEIQSAVDIPFEKVQSILGYFISAELVDRQQQIELIHELSPEGRQYLENKLPEEELIDLVKRNINSISKVKEELTDKKVFDIAVNWAKKEQMDKN